MVDRLRVDAVLAGLLLGAAFVLCACANAVYDPSDYTPIEPWPPHGYGDPTANPPPSDIDAAPRARGDTKQAIQV